MGGSGKYGKAWVVSLALLLFAFGALFAWGCAESEPGEPAGQEEEKEDGTTVEQGGTETITLYFRYSTSDGEWLSPEERTVTFIGDPYRAAMEELIKGPTPGSGLIPVLPNTVVVLGVEEMDGILSVNVSKEILTDANQVGVSARGEKLALAAIADTLTEFEGVNAVRLLIEGTQSGLVEGRFVEDFWGHLGLPELLERDESVIGGEPQVITP